MDLSDTPNGPACLSLTGVRLGSRTRRWGFPCCVQSPWADMPSPLPRWDHRRGCCRSLKPVTAAFPILLPGRLPHYGFRGLLGVHACYGLPARGVAQGDPFHRRLRQYRYLHCRSDCYRLERPLAGWELHPLKIGAFARRTRGTRIIAAKSSRPVDHLARRLEGIGQFVLIISSQICAPSLVFQPLQCRLRLHSLKCSRRT